MSPKKGLVLGAGGARGFAHLGVLQVLEEEKIGMDIAVKNRSPLHIARNMGAEKVLAVDVKRGLMTKLSSAMDILLQSIEILEDEVFCAHCHGADLLIQPDIGHIGSLQFDRAEEGIRLGRSIAFAKSSEIKRIMELGVEKTKFCATLTEDA